MPTSEERLTTLENYFDQFKAETTTYYQEMALQVTMSRGLTEDAVKRLMQLRVQVDKRFNSVDQQLTEMKQTISAHTARFGGIETRLDRIEALLAQVLERLP